MDDETIIYITFSSVVMLIIIINLSAFGSGLYSYAALTLAIFGMVMILIMSFADFVLFPLITTVFGITFQPAKDYRIIKGQDAVLKNVNGLYYATGFITANLFSFVFKAERLQENIEEKQASAPEIWERAVMSISFPFKFHVISTGLDVQKVRDDLEGKRSYQEFNLSRTLQSPNANEVIVTDIQRRISVIQAQIDRISQDEKPIATLMYVETTAVGVTEKAALDALGGQIKQLQIALSSLDVQLTRIAGRELYTLFKFNFALPSTYDELVNNFDRES